MEFLPAGNPVNILAHAREALVVALRKREGIESTRVVAHDYAVSVGQELLGRRAKGALAVELTDMGFLNGGLYPELHRRVQAMHELADAADRPPIEARERIANLVLAAAP